jgi:hypothetical protein
MISSSRDRRDGHIVADPERLARIDLTILH